MITDHCPLCGSRRPWTCPRWHRDPAVQTWPLWLVPLLALLAIPLARCIGR